MAGEATGGNPPHADDAGPPKAVASAASSLVAKVADKMQHHRVGLDLGEVVIEIETCPRFHMQTSLSSNRRPTVTEIWPGTGILENLRQTETWAPATH